jgi:16S rRNA (uracil1498-N3)-methyltransferase
VNLILLLEEDWIESDHRVRLLGRRRRHVLNVHRARLGDELRVGRLGGAVGYGRIVHIDEIALEMEVRLEADPPPPLAVSLVLALPRPPVLGRVLISVTSMGVKRIILLNAGGVEKSFWQSRALAEESIFEQCLLGLEQARDTQMPQVLLRKRFMPFVEDELKGLIAGGQGFVAEPAATSTPAPASIPTGLPAPSFPGQKVGPALLAVGPESGWNSHELGCLESAGLERISLGVRPLRVETVLPALLSRFT